MSSDNQENNADNAASISTLTLEENPQNQTVESDASTTSMTSMTTNVNNEVNNNTKRKGGGGRKSSDIWRFFTNEEKPQFLKSAICKNCNLRINHHKKSEYAKMHLLKCIPFKKLMYGLPIEDRPQWFPSKKPFLGESVAQAQIQTGTLSVASTSSCTSSMAEDILPVRTSQTSMAKFALPLLTEAEKTKLNENVAMFFYKTGTSFSRVQDEHLLKAFNICRPGTALPTRKQLATTLLDKCFENIKKQVTQAIPPNICIVSDAWTNIKGEPIVNYMVVAPSRSFFLEAVSTKNQAHTAQWIADDLSRVIDSIPPPTVVSGAVTDNTSANKLAWKILEQKYPNKYFHGCVCHALNLLVKDIFEEPKIAKRSDVIFPFATIAKFAVECKNIVVFFKNHHTMNYILKKAQKEKNVQFLVQPAKTRWSTVYGCFQSLLASEDILHTIVHSRDFLEVPSQRDVREDIKKTISHPNFLTNLKKSIFILKEIDLLTIKFQGDGVAISEVYADFKELPDYFNSEESRRILDANEIQFIQNKIQERFQFIYGDAHGVCYMLDPRYAGYGMERQLREELEDFIMSFNCENPTTEHKEAVMRQLTDFRLWAQNQKAKDSFRYQQLTKKNKSILEFWMLDGHDYPKLRSLALQVFSMAPSSCSPKRNFSTFGFIHSKLRNLLSEESVEKLIYIKTNGNILTGTADSDDNSESE